MTADLELENPAFTCGHCRFTTALTGNWSVENARLVFRAADDPQPRRGPDLGSCCESSPVVEFGRITTDWGDGQIAGDEFEALRETSRLAANRGDA